MKSPACPGFDALRLSRRQLIKAGGMGALGLTLPKILAGSEYPGGRPPARAKSVIFLFQWGGPSHVDMFDLKLNAPSEYRTPHKAIRTSNPDLLTNEHLFGPGNIVEQSQESGRLQFLVSGVLRHFEQPQTLGESPLQIGVSSRREARLVIAPAQPPGQPSIVSLFFLIPLTPLPTEADQ